ncbi:DUF924 family protein [Propionivibrio sp.]|uniref:DUF924 family protein n=1 Tax=Propionivibrio sp. TaxID=2212460 RepID=UPI003BF18D6C
MNSIADTPDTVLGFWFEEIAPRQWWARSDDLDRVIASRFGALLAVAARCELYCWRASGAGRLAEIIVLDQFSRNVHRDQPQAFACDPMALVLAQEAVAGHADNEFDAVRGAFLYMPYMHSESAVIHRVAAALFGAPGMEQNLDFELRHKAIIDRFGRYPHRNEILGRISTPEEIEFLKTPGSSF